MTNRKIRKKKRQTWGGRAHSGTGIPAGNRNRMVGSIQPDRRVTTPKFKKLRNRLWDYDDCIELQDLSDPVGESLMGEPFECPTPSAMAYDLFKALRIWDWLNSSKYSSWEKVKIVTMDSPRTRTGDCSWSVEDSVMIYPMN